MLVYVAFSLLFQKESERKQAYTNGQNSDKIKYKPQNHTIQKDLGK